MRIPEGSPSKKTAVFSSSFQSVENKSMVAETLEEYALDYVESAYENPWEQEPMGLMALGR